MWPNAQRHPKNFVAILPSLRFMDFFKEQKKTAKAAFFIYVMWWNHFFGPKAGSLFS
jgi:hypothetical protein